MFHAAPRACSRRTAHLRAAFFLLFIFFPLPRSCLLAVRDHAFNLSALGALSIEAGGFRYTFSPCAPLSAPAGRCDGLAPAHVFQDNDAACIRVGEPGSLALRLLPGGAGLALAFIGGDSCGERGRSFLLSLRCAQGGGPASAPRVGEYAVCAYAAEVIHLAGCPLLCPPGAPCAPAAGNPPLDPVFSASTSAPLRLPLLSLLLLLTIGLTICCRFFFESGWHTAALGAFFFSLLTLLTAKHFLSPLQPDLLQLRARDALEPLQEHLRNHHCDGASFPAEPVALAATLLPFDHAGLEKGLELRVSPDAPCAALALLVSDGLMLQLGYAPGGPMMGSEPFEFEGGGVCVNESGALVESSARVAFSCDQKPQAVLLSRTRCRVEATAYLPAACDGHMAPVRACPAVPSGSWALGPGAGDGGARIAKWLPRPPCELFGRAAALNCLANVSLFYLGDSVSWAMLLNLNAFLQGCENVAGAPCEAAWEATREPFPKLNCDEPGGPSCASVHPECRGSRALCSHVLRVEPHGITLRALRYETVNRVTYKGLWPFHEELLLSNNTEDYKSSIVVLNLAHHDLHFYNDVAGYLESMRLFVSRLANAPRWRSAAARASGALVWRSLTPTEFPAKHKLEGEKHPVELYARVDQEVAAMWRGAGFPVVNVTAIAFDVRGNLQRTVTYDSLHFPDKVNYLLNRHILAQLCELRNGYLVS
jgi:hypothetical protein